MEHFVAMLFSSLSLCMYVVSFWPSSGLFFSFFFSSFFHTLTNVYCLMKFRTTTSVIAMTISCFFVLCFTWIYLLLTHSLKRERYWWANKADSWFYFAVWLIADYMICLCVCVLMCMSLIFRCILSENLACFWQCMTGLVPNLIFMSQRAFTHLFCVSLIDFSFSFFFYSVVCLYFERKRALSLTATLIMIEVYQTKQMILHGFSHNRIHNPIALPL